MSKQRLFVVRIVREAYVLAESADEARDLLHEIEQWDEPAIDVEPWHGQQLALWNDQCLVYGPERDMTLGEAKALHAKEAA
jgi:hypothetical protein